MEQILPEAFFQNTAIPSAFALPVQPNKNNPLSFARTFFSASINPFIKSFKANQIIENPENKNYPRNESNCENAEQPEIRISGTKFAEEIRKNGNPVS